MSPRSGSGGPKSGPRGPKTAPSRPQEPPGAPQEAPKSSQERTKRAPREPRGPSGRPRGPFWPYFGGPWASFQAIEASFSKLARAPPDNRKQSSKSLVKRSSLGLACVWGQKTQPRRGSSRFLRPRRLTLRIQLASQACFFTRRTSKTFGFYVVPCFPRLSSPTRGSPRPEITRKCCSKSPVKRSFKTAAGQKRTRTMAQWPGFGGACPTGDPATEPLRLKRGPWSEANCGLRLLLTQTPFGNPNVYRR